jgi:parallel beta-helix repeat protein
MFRKSILTATLAASIIGASIFSFLAPPPALYASPSGSGTACSEVAPCTLTEAIRQGGKIVMRGGTYAAPATGWQFTRTSTLENYPNEVVTLTSKSKTSGNYIIKCLLSSPAVDNVQIIGSDVGRQKGIVMTGEFLGIAPAIVAYQCDGWEIAGIEFKDVGYAIFQRKVDNGNTSADGWYVHDNLISDYFRESGMQFNGNSNRIENNRIIKQTGNSSTTYGCQLLNLLGNNNIVRGNYLERVNQSVRCIGIFFEWDLADSNLIENNIIKGVPNGISFFGGDNNIIRNNTLSGIDTAFVIRSWADNVTAYPCNFSSFMPLESDTSSPDWQYMYPHDCRSKGNRFENNTVSGFSRFSMIDLPEASNVFVTSTATKTIYTPTNTITASPTFTPTLTTSPTNTATKTFTPRPTSTATPTRTPTVVLTPVVILVNGTPIICPCNIIIP